MTTNTASGGGGVGAVTYVSSNPSAVTVDRATGAASAVGAGTSLITATKAADPNFLEAQATYTVHSQPVATISAFIGSAGASVVLPASANGRSFVRARVADCATPLAIQTCPAAEVSTVSGGAIADTRATLATPAYFSVALGATQAAPIEVHTARFSNRVGHAAVRFNNRYWVIAGGEPVAGSPITHVAKADVWSSADGKTWKLETADGGFGARWFPEVVVFNNRLWLISGAKLPVPALPEYPWFEDVWSSADGVSWTLENPDLDFPWWPTDLDIVAFNGAMWAVSGGRTYSSTTGQFVQRSATPGLTGTTLGRSGASLTVYDNQLWYIGGKPDLPLGSPPNGTSMNDVWRSSDGITWTQVLANGHAFFSPRYRHAAFVANGRLWVLGGQSVTNGVEGDVAGDAWSTADGVTWREESVDALSRAYYLPVVQESGRVTIIGGIQAAYSNTVWQSTDGANWSELSTHAQFSPRRTRGATFKGQMWIVGGTGAGMPDADTNEVWRSSDGVNWNRVAASGPVFSARSNHEVVVLNDRLWVVGGWSNPTGASGAQVRLNDVWSSADGITWRQETAAASFAPRVGHAAAAFNGRLWVAGGNTAGGLVNDVWSSSDGIAWTQATANAAFSARGSARMVAFQNAIWLIGGGAAGSNEIWRSDDGATWTQVATAAPMFAARTRHAATVLNGRIYVVGGATNETTAGLSLNDVWSSADGVAWRQEAATAPFLPRLLHVLLAHDNELWVIAGFGAGDMNDVWRSTDGSSWRVGFSRDIAAL